MSRHRLVKQLNLADELDDDALDSFDGEEDADYQLDEDQRIQMDSGLVAVQSTLGSDLAGFTEREVKDTLWNLYFDVEQTIEALLE